VESATTDQFDALFRAAPLGILAADHSGQVVRVNPALAQMFGYLPEELVGQQVELLLPEPLRHTHLAHRSRFVEAPHTRPMGQGLDLLGRHCDGHVFPVEVSLTHLVLDGTEASVAFVANVSERVRLSRERDQLLADEQQARLAAGQAEELHEAALAQLHTFVQSAPIGLGFLDLELRFQLSNAQLSAMTALPREAHLGRTLGETLPAAGHLEPRIRQVLATGEPLVDLEIQGGDAEAPGQERHFRVSAYPVARHDGHMFGVGIITREITAHVRSEEALRRSEHRFRAIFDDAPLGIVLASPAGRILATNTAFQRMLGYSADELLAMGPQHFVHPDDLGEGLQIRDAIAAGRQGQTTLVRRYVRKDGATLRVRITASLAQGGEGEQFLLILLEDVTEQLQAEEARARLAAIVDSTDDAIIGVTLEQIIVAWNTAAERLYGYSAAEAISQAKTLIVPEDRYAELEQIREAVARGESISHLETVRRHKGGRLIDVSLTCSPIADSTGTLIGISTIARDISERKRVTLLLHRQAMLTHLLEQVAVAANQAVSVDEALQDAINTICRTIGWPIGHAYLASEGAGDPLRTTSIWHLDDPERFRVFQAITEAVTLPAPDDLPGRALLSGKPEWISDLAENHARPRFSIISDLGVRSGFAFPVLVGAEVAAVLEFFATQPQSPDAELLEVMAHVGAQLGRVIERERAEQAVRKSEQHYRTLARNLPNGSVLLFDQQLRFTIADGSALSDAGLSRERVEGRTLAEVLPPASVARLEPLYRAALGGVRSELEVEAGERIYQSHILPVPDERGAIIAGMVMSYEITELKRIERELREERAQLTRRVAERTADLSLANAELARASRLKDEFLANMSHELRTPLNSILGRAEALQEEIYGPVTPKQQEVLRGVEESGRHLLNLINDILDLSKIEAGRLELALDPVDINLICHTSLRMVAQLALTKQVALTSTIDAQVETIQADERRLKQILVNLLSNAVKFTPAGGKVGLEVSGDPERQTVTFTVSDTGIGIADEHLAKLFQPFVQIDSSLSRQYAGTGLGLALVMRLAEAHGGSVAVESEPGQGSSFSVALPWVPEVKRSFLVEGSRVPELGVPAIQHALVVEDSATAAGQLARYLRELGAEVEVSAQGTATAARAIALQPNVIILDILLPGQSGWDVLQALKAEPRTRAIPVIVVSVVDEPARARELGAAAFLLKPISRTAFMEALLQVVQSPATLQTRTALVVASDTARPRILLAEDNEATIDVLSDYLQAHGYEVIVARNGAEAVIAAQGDRVALILMDIQMPGMDGLEAIHRLRADPDTQDVPVIALTALAMPGDRERCLEAGANVYLAKPLNLRALLATIRSQLGNATAL
jgi:PAS domain S-box-containing protein